MSWTCGHFVHSAEDIGTLEIMDKFYLCSLPGWKFLLLFWKLLSHGLLLSNVVFLSHLNTASKCNVVQSSKAQQQSKINKHSAILFCDSSILLSFGYDYSCGNLFSWILTNTVCFTWKLFSALANAGFEFFFTGSSFSLSLSVPVWRKKPTKNKKQHSKLKWYIYFLLLVSMLLTRRWEQYVI